MRPENERLHRLFNPERGFSRRRFLRYGLGVGLSTALPELKLLSNPVENYARLLVDNHPVINRPDQYHEPLREGIGYTTLHRLTFECCRNQAAKIRRQIEVAGQDSLTEADRNILRITREGDHSIRQALVSSSIDPLAGLARHEYIALGAVRSPANIGDEFLLCSADSPSPSDCRIRIHGWILAVDCPDPAHWLRQPYRRHYQYLGWDLPWIAELSPEAAAHLPPGLSGRQNELMEGKPGAILIRKDAFLALLDSPSTSSGVRQPLFR